MDKTRIAITGIGAVSAAGPNASALEQGLERGSRIFAPNRRHPVDFEIVVGEADEDWFAATEHTSLESDTGRLCLAAARECARDAKDRGAGNPDGLVLGTSTGGQSQNEEIVFALVDQTQLPDFSYRRQGCMAAPSRLVARDLDIRGPVQTVSTACTSSTNAIAVGATWLTNGRCNRVLAGGGDALCYTTISSFHILELTGSKMCTPFGADRPGMTLGDGAGFVLLERLDDVLASGREPLAELLGFGMSGDAHHMTAPPEDGAGAELAMRRALKSAGLSPCDIHHINAHGTGTRLNDAAEATAINKLFDSDMPVMSCKGLVGHTLGGAGGIEAVASVLAVGNRRAFENIGARTPSEDCPVRLVPSGGLELPENPIVLSNSFAFGGNNSSLVFGAPGSNR
ncbi:MAG: beta-ketoacyl-[acyl-carrier-protein] synthase family protein [Deltaproteobacteria bacterium]|nr:beta-ketoacyl-[acyl-carrier-protein] synthase family protein [Deltaproteobacteria bacterium]